jgi:hypothetical protein
MEINLKNYSGSFVVLFSVDSMSKQEREEGVVPSGVSMSFWVPPGAELRIKDFNSKDIIHTVIANPPVPRGATQTHVWEERGHPDNKIVLYIREAVTLSGFWTYRSFNPMYVTGDQTEAELILTEAVFDFRTPTSTTLEGTIEWRTGPQPEEKDGLDLKGTIGYGVGGEPISFEIVGTGRAGTGTSGWEYDYYGHLTPYGHLIPHWPEGVGTPVIVGSVIRAKAHGDRPAGSVYSFIAVKQPPFRSEITGLWTYRSFHNNPATIYPTAPQKTQPTTRDLLLQEAGFVLRTPTSTTLQGEIFWLGGSLDLKGTVRPGAEGEPSSFEMTGTGRPGTGTAGWEYHYQGHLTRPWPNGIDQRPALVGSVFRAKAHGDAPAGYVAPFIAVKRNDEIE